MHLKKAEQRLALVGVALTLGTLAVIGCGPTTTSTTSAPPPTITPLPATDNPPPPDTPLPDVTFEGITFSYDQSLASGVSTEIAPSAEFISGDVIPAHFLFTFEGYILPGTFHEPHIYIYPVGALESGGPTLAGTVADLRQFLADRPTQPATIPFLPLFNAAQLLRTQIVYLDFQNGAGVRFLTQYAQAFIPINNNELFYTFQGLTGDDAYYIAAVLPVSHPSLPADESEIPGGDFDAFADNFDAYIADTAQQLGAQDGSTFTPGLPSLDVMIRSLAVNPAQAP